MGLTRKEHTANAERYETLQLLWTGVRGEETTDDLTRDDAHTNKNRHVADIHGIAIVVQDSHLCRPDDGEGVVDTSSKPEQHDRCGISTVLEQMHRDQRLLQRHVALPQHENDERREAEHDRANDSDGLPRIHSAAPGQTKDEDDEACRE